MAVRPTPHHTTSRTVAQTLEVYDRDARLFLTCSLRRAGREVQMLRVVINQERKGRWINLIARPV
jgi:hypothetical protein